jgi:hypothetical protein
LLTDLFNPYKETAGKFHEERDKFIKTAKLIPDTFWTYECAFPELAKTKRLSQNKSDKEAGVKTLQENQIIRQPFDTAFQNIIESFAVHPAVNFIISC